MNKIILKGYIKDIQFSHKIKDIEFYKAKLICKRDNSEKEDVITIKFKNFCNQYKENDFISIVGNVRSFSQILENGKNTVELYVFTYQDKPDENINNKVIIDGKICKKLSLKKTKNNKDVLDFIFANNIIVNDSYLNAYLPCVAWDKNAIEISDLPIGTSLTIEGTLNSRIYKKRISNNDFELRLAHEININNYKININNETN